jgi:ATP-dependent protease ClpP protease subunit
MDGYNIGSLDHRSHSVDTYNVGISASIAGVIWMCGRSRLHDSYALLMTISQMEAIKGQHHAGITSNHAGAKKQFRPAVISLMNQTTWMTAQSVWRKGFCTEIEGTKGVQ